MKEQQEDFLHLQIQEGADSPLSETRRMLDDLERTRKSVEERMAATHMRMQEYENDLSRGREEIEILDDNPTVVDTDLIGFTALTAGSRTTFATGWAAYEAAQDVKRQMINRASEIWDVDPETIELKDGEFRSVADPELKISFKDLAGRLNDSGGPIMGRATIDPKGVGGSASGCIVDVEVDPETGKVDILRVTSFQDAGKAVHPSYVEGQMQGGSVQGIGWGLNEEYFYDDAGEMTNGSFLDYRMPTSLDLPMIDTVIIEVANPGHPYGVRGVGESSIISPPAALANAIYQAVGIRMNVLPMNPGAVLEAQWGEEKADSADN